MRRQPASRTATSSSDRISYRGSVLTITQAPVAPATNSAIAAANARRLSSQA